MAEDSGGGLCGFGSVTAVRVTLMVGSMGAGRLAQSFEMIG